MSSTPPAVVITDKNSMRSWTRSQRSQNKTIALVPTMGFLHDGHLSLIRAATSHADVTVVSIYLNPSQFSPNEDLSTYPSDLQGDLLKLSHLPVHAVFCPTNLYHTTKYINNNNNNMVSSCLEEDEHETWIRVERLEKGLCGKSRPVFFRGVATVVAKLFNVVEPDVAVFGKKDYQQWRVICRMVRDLDFAVEIVGCEVVREGDGLAMSSRNVRLSAEDRQKALSINRSLTEAKFAAQNGQSNCEELRSSIIQKVTKAGGIVDYVEIVEQQTLKQVEKITSPVVICVAAMVGNVRLIDNMEINI